MISITTTLKRLFLSLILLGGFLPVNAHAETPEIRFGVLTDVQYADQEQQGTLFYRASLKKLQNAVDAFNGEELDFVIHLGDLIDNQFQNYDRTLPIWNQLTTKRYLVLGNHDYDVAENKKSQVVDKLGLEQRYYDFLINKWRFIVLDGNELSFHAHRKDTPEHKESTHFFDEIKGQSRMNALPYNGGVNMKQFKWLQEKLTKACAAEESVIIFSHYPIYPRHKTNLWNDRELLGLIESHSCVFSYMSGHNHLGAYAAKKGVHHLTFKGVVETPNTNAYAVLEVYKDRIEVLGKGRERSLTLKRSSPDMIAPLVLDPIQPVEAVGFSTEPPKKIPVPKALKDSRAFRQYQVRSKSELSKLLFLIERFKEFGVSIIYDGVEYDTDFSIKVARRYLARKYRREKADKWIKLHTYRSQHAGDVIKMKFPDNKTRVMRDAFLEELEALEKLLAS